MRLRNKYNDIQIVVTHAKAERLILEGVYVAVPDDEQPLEQVDALDQPAGAESKPGPTSIADALKAAVGPAWQIPVG